MRIAYPLPYPYPIPCPYPWPYQRPEQRQGSASGFSARKQRPAQRQNPTRARGKPRPIGVPGLTLCRIDAPASPCPPHNVIPGSLARRDEVSSPGYEAGRRRTIGVVAALPITSARPRRWCDAGPSGRPGATAAQKAGDDGSARNSNRESTTPNTPHSLGNASPPSTTLTGRLESRLHNLRPTRSGSETEAVLGKKNPAAAHRGAAAGVTAVNCRLCFS